jgi:hypothetical protein
MYFKVKNTLNINIYHNLNHTQNHILLPATLFNYEWSFTIDFTVDFVCVFDIILVFELEKYKFNEKNINYNFFN